MSFVVYDFYEVSGGRWYWEIFVTGVKKSEFVEWMDQRGYECCYEYYRSPYTARHFGTLPDLTAATEFKLRWL